MSRARSISHRTVESARSQQTRRRSRWGPGGRTLPSSPTPTCPHATLSTGGGIGGPHSIPSAARVRRPSSPFANCPSFPNASNDLFRGGISLASEFSLGILASRDFAVSEFRATRFLLQNKNKPSQRGTATDQCPKLLAAQRQARTRVKQVDGKELCRGTSREAWSLSCTPRVAVVLGFFIYLFFRLAFFRPGAREAIPARGILGSPPCRRDTLRGARCWLDDPRAMVDSCFSRSGAFVPRDESKSLTLETPQRPLRSESPSPRRRQCLLPPRVVSFAGECIGHVSNARQSSQFRSRSRHCAARVSCWKPSRLIRRTSTGCTWSRGLRDCRAGER